MHRTALGSQVGDHQHITLSYSNTAVGWNQGEYNVSAVALPRTLAASLIFILLLARFPPRKCRCRHTRATKKSVSYYAAVLPGVLSCRHHFIHMIHGTNHPSIHSKVSCSNTAQRKPARGIRSISTSSTAVHRVEHAGLSHLDDEQASRLRPDGGRLAGLQERHLLRKVLEHEPVNQPYRGRARRDERKTPGICV